MAMPRLHHGSSTVFLNLVMGEWRRTRDEVTLLYRNGGQLIGSRMKPSEKNGKELQFADDIAILTRTRPEMETAIQVSCMR